MDDFFDVWKVVFLLLITICSIYIACVIEEINEKLTPENCITVEDKVYCERELKK